MRRLLGWLETTAKILIVAALLLWAADWIVFRVRAAHGSSFGAVQVQEYLSTDLKGNKTEFDFMGTRQQRCARALFPHAGVNPCWWLRRHTTQWE